MHEITLIKWAAIVSLGLAIVRVLLVDLKATLELLKPVIRTLGSIVAIVVSLQQKK